jgi:hypothetical protein
MVEQPIHSRPVAGSMPALERKDASAVESESGLIPECIAQSGRPPPRKGDGSRLDSHGGVILLCCPQGRRKMNAEGTDRKLEPPPV